MADKVFTTEIDLHIGCGIHYKPDFINIDLYENSVFDLGAHAAFLPFKEQSIRSIEAYHLIEHFSWVEVKYLLNEWFRTLEKGGSLILEVPDLLKACKELKNLKTNDFQSQVAKLQWIFGIQEEGMKHKSGFTFSVLSNFLQSVGFIDVKKEKQETHTYEKGLRISCKKPYTSNDLSKDLLSNFRSEITLLYFFGHLKPISLLERKIIQEIEPLFTNNLNAIKKETLLKVIIQLSICNPLLAVKFLKLLQTHSILPKSYLNNINEVVTNLLQTNFHKKLFTLWKLRKKSPGNMKNDFSQFINEIELKIFSTFKENAAFQKKFSYISSLNQVDIPFFDKYFILHKASILFHQGIRSFTYGQYEQAEEFFKSSIKLNPDNYLTYWNLGRISKVLNKDYYKDNYQIAYTLATKKTLKRKINAELKKIFSSTENQKFSKPVIQA